MTDTPPEPLPPQEQVIEQRLVACGLNAAGFTVKYEGYLQSIEIVIAPEAGASREDFDCIRKAAGHEIVTFGDRDMHLAYLDRSFEAVRPRLLADAKADLAKRGLLETFPRRAEFASDKMFGEALERHCGIQIGSFFVEGERGLIAKPAIEQLRPSSRDWDKMACMTSVMIYANLSGDGFKIGFVGNAKGVDDDEP